ncbi:hypothetical protein LIER_44071 [Lithospermum erythrorhizon]|uniref:Uncharacterized protein n=1 Tax=Lithospermum erythrorhizon TaxID=34254 RepID=A0AAV3P376_LITER
MESILIDFQQIQYIKLEEVKLLSEEMADVRATGKKSTDEWHRGSHKKGQVWERLEKPKDNLHFKRPRMRSPRREDVRPQEDIRTRSVLIIPHSGSLWGGSMPRWRTRRFF